MSGTVFKLKPSLRASVRGCNISALGPPTSGGGAKSAAIRGSSVRQRLAETELKPWRKPGVSYPRYIGGERNGPPEDCGGIPGFYQLLEAITDPAHPDHAHVKEWAKDYDPATFDPLPIKYALGRIANRRNAAKVGLAKKKHSSAA
jgi:hypothetical protein